MSNLLEKQQKLEISYEERQKIKAAILEKKMKTEGRVAQRELIKMHKDNK